MADFLSLPQMLRKIVFYAEDLHSMLHYRAIIKRLTSAYGEDVCYLTSARDDPILDNHPPRLRPFYIGEGTVRTLAFLRLKADLLILTMPNLETYHIKRSKVYPVHYLYLFHALVSTHSIYRRGAFDHYDTVFCASPYQIEEIRATEAAYLLPKKSLLEAGYMHLEALMEDAEHYRISHGGPAVDGPKTVVVAPSWGPDSILETCGVELVKRLLDVGYKVVVRPHPMTTKRSPRVIGVMRRVFDLHPSFRLQTDVRDQEALYASHVMISDWSGVAMEYAFACERPVIFIDVPKKCFNPEVDRIPQIPIEVSIRERIGRVVAPDALEQLPVVIESLYGDAGAFIDQIRRARDDCVFNLGRSVEVSADKILELADTVQAKNSKA